MYRTTKTVFLLCALSLTVSANASGGEPPKAAIPCVDEDVEVTRRAGDELVVSTPKKNKKFGEITCMGGLEVWHDENGRLRVCTVAKPVEVNGVPIAKEAYTHFHANGNANQTTISAGQTFETAAGETVKCVAGFASFSETGHITYCTLKTDRAFGSVECKGGESLAFHDDDGSLARCTIAKPVEALDTTFAAGTNLSFHRSGAIEGAWLPDPQNVAGYDLRWDFKAYETGQLRHFEAAKDMTISGHKIPDRADVWLRRDGSLQQIKYIEDSGFMIHGEQWTDTATVRFDCAGKESHRSVEHWQADIPPPNFRRRK